MATTTTTKEKPALFPYEFKDDDQRTKFKIFAAKQKKTMQELMKDAFIKAYPTIFK